MKRNKIYFLISSIIITILLQLFLSKIICYDTGLLIFTSLAYLCIFAFSMENISYILKKKLIKYNVIQLLTNLSAFTALTTLNLNVSSDIAYESIITPILIISLIGFFTFGSIAIKLEQTLNNRY